MGIISTLYDLSQSTFGLFSGDDSLIIGGDIAYDRNDMCATLFNLEFKMFKYKKSYFCSKFLLNVNGVFRLIPDPLKTITKLGRHDLVDYIHVEEYRRSYADLLKDLNDATVNDELSAAINERYQCEMLDHTHIFCALNKIINDPEEFAQLNYVPKRVVLLNDPSRPKLN